MTALFKFFLSSRETACKRLAVFSLFLFIVLFAFNGGKSAVSGGAVLGLLFLATALSLKFNDAVVLLRHPLVPAALGFLIWVIFSTVLSEVFWQGLIPIMKILATGAFWMTASLTWERKHRNIFKGILWGVASFQAFLVLLSHFMDYPFPLLLPGNPQYVAFWITLSSLSAFDNMAKAVHSRTRVGWGLLAGYLTVALFALPSRSGFVACAAGVSLLMFRYYRWRSLLYGTAIVLLCVVLIPNSLWRQSLKMNDPLAWKRLDIWTSTVKGIAVKPLLGWGSGNYINLYNAQALPQPLLPVRYDRSTPFAHNDFLQAAAEYGFPALVFLVFGFVWGLIGGIDTEKKSVLMAASVFSLFNFPFYLPVNGWLLAGLLSVENRGTPVQRSSSILKMGLVALMVVIGSISFGVAGLRGMVFNIHPWNLDQVLDASDKKLHMTSSINPDDILNVEADLRRVVFFSPNNARAWRDLAHLKSDHSVPPRLEESREDMNRAVALHPTQAVWALEWGKIVMRQGDRHAALWSAHRALALEPGYAEAALFLGSVLRQTGESEKAETWLRNSLLRHERSRPAPELLSSYARTILHLDADAIRLEIARCQSAQKKYSQSLNTLSLVTSDPAGLRSFEEAGAHYAMGKYAEAERCLLQALSLDKGNQMYNHNLDLVRRKNK